MGIGSNARRANTAQSTGSNSAHGRARTASMSGSTVEDAFDLPPLAAATPSGPPVAIYGVDQTGRVRFEGRACKGAPTGRKPLEHWVTFVGESRPRRRLVLPNPFQSQADAILRGLQALYADAGSPADMPDLFLTDVLRASAANDNHASDEKEA